VEEDEYDVNIRDRWDSTPLYVIMKSFYGLSCNHHKISDNNEKLFLNKIHYMLCFLSFH